MLDWRQWILEEMTGEFSMHSMNQEGTHGHEASVELAGRKHDHPEPRIGTLLAKTVADPDCHGTRDEDRQQF